MYKFFASIRKEIQLLFSDKVGLSLLFGMPILLVFVITIVQDSAYKMVNENKISILISNQDKGKESKLLLHQLDSSGLFNITYNNQLNSETFKTELINRKILTGLVIPVDFSKKLKEKAKSVSNGMLSQMGLIEAKKQTKITIPSLKFYHDPILMNNYCQSIEGMFNSYLSIVENKLMLESIYDEVGIEGGVNSLEKELRNDQVKIETIVAIKSETKVNPNSSQHNVPAWTIFAMFFMVTSLGGNISKEKLNGSFMRLKTLPTSFSLMLLSKMLVYLIVAFLQIIVIFSIGVFVFPYINLPQLNLPHSLLPVFVVVLLTGLSAVCYSILVGILAKTQEQANGFGAISIILFAAIGGVWVPTFVMPEYLQMVSKISPLNWCLEGFYTLFLRDGNWVDLLPVITYLVSFICICILIVIIRLKSKKLL